MKHLRQLILPLILGPIAAGCTHPSGNTTVTRLDRTLASGTLPTDTRTLDATRTLFMVSGYGEPTDSLVARYASMPSIAIHRHSVDSAFTDMASEEAALGKVFSSLGDMLDGFTPPAVYAVISPFNQSVIMADSVLFIGLNHYLGTDYAPYGYFPDFIRARKVRARLPLDVAEAVVRTRRPFVPQSAYPTLLDRLIYEGAVTQAVMNATGATEADVLGYDREQSRWLRDNETAMWNTLLHRNLIYSTDDAVIRSATSLSPATTVVSPETPGGAGRYIGSHIVGAWLAGHPDATVDSILTHPLPSPQFLRDSGY